MGIAASHFAVAVGKHCGKIHGLTRICLLPKDKMPIPQQNDSVKPSSFLWYGIFKTDSGAPPTLPR